MQVEHLALGCSWRVHVHVPVDGAAPGLRTPRFINALYLAQGISKSRNSHSLPFLEGTELSVSA